MQKFLIVSRLIELTRWVANSCLLVFLLVANSSAARADEKYESPFVAGFDRFFVESPRGARICQSDSL